MTVDVEIGGRVRRVELVRVERGWQVAVDGRTQSVDVAEAGDRMSLLIGPAEGGHEPPDVASRFSRTSYDIAVDDRGRGELVVHVNGIVVPLTIADPRAARSRGGQEHGGKGSGPHPVLAPMPGRVVKVLVKPGDDVAPRQGLVVVEAMKMENELRSPRAGTVSEVRVAEGALVEAKAVLVVIT